MRSLPAAFALTAVAALGAPAVSQTPAELKQELKTREAAASDATSLAELATWAKQNGLLADHRRLLEKALELDPDNQAAREALGFVRFDGKWMEKAKAEELQLKAQEADLKAKGLVKVDGVWVEKNDVADAKRGVFHHEGELVSREEKLALLGGQVRHPATGQLISAADLAKAEQGLFCLDGGRWVEESEADSYHADTRHPWVLRSYYTTVITTLPLKSFQEVKTAIDGTVEGLKPLFAGRLPHPSHRPVIVVCPTTDEYKKFGEAVGGPESSGYGAFLAEKPPAFESIELTAVPAIANFGEQGWGQYYVRHAVGLAYAKSMGEEVGAKLPKWLVCGVAALGERLQTAAAFFAEQHVQKGGVKDLKDWFADFQISVDIPKERCEYNVFQSGLLLSFAMHGGDPKATEALQTFTAAFDDAKGKAVEKAVQKLERVLITKEDELRAYLQAIIRKG